MEILTPQQEAPQESNPQNQSNDTVGNGLSLKNLEFMNYLGLKDKLFDSQTMSKVAYLSENLPDLSSLQALDWKVGQDPNMSRIDRVFTYLQLDQQSREQEARLRLINEAKQRYVK